MNHGTIIEEFQEEVGDICLEMSIEVSIYWLLEGHG